MWTKVFVATAILIAVGIFIAGIILPKPVGKQPVVNEGGNNPTTSDKCIITINGQDYDFSTFRKIHKGGDVFKCGTDISAQFAKQHPIAFLEKVVNFKL